MGVVAIGDPADRVAQDLHRRLGHVLVVVRRAGLAKVLQLPRLLPAGLDVQPGLDAGERTDRLEPGLGLGIVPVIPSKENEDRSARPVEFDKDAYRRRSIVENLIGWLKECRREFSRFEKTAMNFGGMSKMASIERYLRLTC